MCPALDSHSAGRDSFLRFKAWAQKVRTLTVSPPDAADFGRSDW